MKNYASMSGAIREGAKLRPQGFHGFPSQLATSCAVAAAVEAIADKEAALQGRAGLVAYSQFPYLAISALCPTCNKDGFDIYRVIVHLNDDHRWTREKIADWVERQEEKLGYVTVIEASESVSQPVSVLSQA